MDKLEMHKGQRILPEYWYNEKAKERNLRNLKGTLTKASIAVKSLHDLTLKSFGESVNRKSWAKDWHDLTEDWLQSHISERLASIDALPLTEPMKQRIRQQWETTRETATKWLHDIDALRTVEASGAKIRLNPEYSFICDNAEELAAVGTAYPIGSEAVELWRLCQNLRADYNKIRSFVNNHNLKELTIAALFTMNDPNSFAQSWALGLLAKTPTTTQASNLADYMFHDDEKPRLKTTK